MTQWQQLKKRLSEFSADPEQILTQLEEQYQAAQEGYKQQKVSVKDGVLDVVEIYPNLMLNITKTRLALWQYLNDLEQKDQAGPAVLDVRVVESIAPVSRA